MKKTNKKAALVWGEIGNITKFILFLVIATAVFIALKNNWLGLQEQVDAKYLTKDWDKDGLPNGVDTCSCTHSKIDMDDHPDGGRETCVATWDTKEKCLDDGREDYFKWYEDEETGKKMCYYENKDDGCVDWLRDEFYPSLDAEATQNADAQDGTVTG